MQGITIRPATKSDEAVLARYGGALMRQHHELDPQRFILTDRPEAGYGRFLLSCLLDPDSVVLVAERAGELVGYVYAGLEPLSWRELRAPCGFVHDVYVDVSVRHQGIGERLVHSAIAWVAAKGLPRVVLWSAARNDAAQRLFDRLGFPSHHGRDDARSRRLRRGGVSAAGREGSTGYGWATRRVQSVIKGTGETRSSSGRTVTRKRLPSGATS
jgi:GNAT superfamily N-acetyltransferase